MSADFGLCGSELGQDDSSVIDGDGVDDDSSLGSRGAGNVHCGGFRSSTTWMLVWASTSVLRLSKGE